MATILDLRNNEETFIDLNTKEGEKVLEDIQEQLFGQVLFDKDDPVLNNVTFGVF